jgi:hypothetical protein
MKTKLFLVVLLFCGQLLITSGCSQPATPNDKEARLIAAENIELKKQIAQLEKDIQKQKLSLDRSEKELQDCRELSRKNVREQVKDVLDNVIDENSKLRQQIKELQAEIQTLKSKNN